MNLQETGFTSEKLREIDERLDRLQEYISYRANYLVASNGSYSNLITRFRTENDPNYNNSLYGRIMSFDEWLFWVPIPHRKIEWESGLLIPQGRAVEMLTPPIKFNTFIYENNKL